MGNGEMDASDCLSYYILTKQFHLVCNLQNDLSLQVIYICTYMLHKIPLFHTSIVFNTW